MDWWNDEMVEWWKDGKQRKIKLDNKKIRHVKADDLSRNLMPECCAWSETNSLNTWRHWKTHIESSYICDLNQVQHLLKNKNILRALREITSLASELVNFLGSCRLMGVSTIFWLKIPGNKLNERSRSLSLCICCSEVPALISRM